MPSQPSAAGVRTSRAHPRAHIFFVAGKSPHFCSSDRDESDTQIISGRERGFQDRSRANCAQIPAGPGRQGAWQASFKIFRPVRNFWGNCRARVMADQSHCSRFRRKRAAGDQQSTQRHAVGRVDVEHRDGRAAGGGPSGQHGPIPLKVIRPVLASGVEEHCHVACGRVDPRQVARFGEIAIVTRPGQVFFTVPASVFRRNDVLDVERIDRKIILVQAAVFASARDRTRARVVFLIMPVAGVGGAAAVPWPAGWQ